MQCKCESVSIGLVIDWRHGRLLFTNEDSVTLNGVTYSWQRIETIRLDGSGRRAIVTTDIQLPRGLAVDSIQQSVAIVAMSLHFYLVRCAVCLHAAAAVQLLHLGYRW